MSSAITRVLVVDDEDEANCEGSMAAGLRVEGFDVETAVDAEAALGWMARAEFDVVIADLMMPIVNGIQLARLIRDKHPNARVVLMSAYHLSEPQLVRCDCGAVGFIPKPFKSSELARLLRSKRSGENPLGSECCRDDASTVVAPWAAA
jgi:DNA-binding response OmpR family regulator